MESQDKPKFNQPFLTRYRFRNDETMDGRSLLQPRFGFTYDVNDDIVLRGGVGLFSGGNPNVWLSNNYSNDGVSAADFICQNVSGSTNRCNFPSLSFVAPFNPLAPNLNDFTYPGSGRPFYEVPQQGIDFIAGANAVGSVNALDPNFEIPSQWKLALGTTIDFETAIPFVGNDWTFNADALLAEAKESAIVVPLGYTVSRIAADGRPIYTGNTNDFVLTNSKKKPYSQVYSFALRNEYDNGIDWTLGYAYTNARDTNPMTSSVAFSNFSNYATRDPVNIPLSTSDYENTHRITFNLNWELAWAENWETNISLFGAATRARPTATTSATRRSPTPTWSSRSRAPASWPTSPTASPTRSSRRRRTLLRLRPWSPSSTATTCCLTTRAASLRATSGGTTGSPSSISSSRRTSRASWARTRSRAS